MFRLATVCLVLVSCGLSGCASARYVSKDVDSGVIAIPHSGSVKSREKAEELMLAHFPTGYEIVKEEEVVIGQTTTFNEDQSERSHEHDSGLTLASGSSHGEATTVDKTEYRIHYRRK